MKKSLLITLSTIALASAALLTACGTSSSDSPGTGSPGTGSPGGSGGGKSSSALRVDLSQQVPKKTAITVWMDDPNGNYFSALKEKFALVEKNIILKTQKVGNVESLEQLKLKGPSGNGADIVQFPHDQLSSFVSQDLAAQIDGDLLDTARSRVTEAALGLTKFIDPRDKISKHFAIPKEVESPGLYFNKSLIQKENIPTTFEDIIKEHKSKNNKFYGSADNWTNVYMGQIYMSPFGFRPFGANGDDAQNIGFKTAEYKAALENLRKLKTELSIPDTAESNDKDAFTKGTLPLLYAGPWEHGNFTKAGIDYGRIPLPTLNGKKMQPFMGAQLVAIYKNTRFLEESKKFLQFLLSDDAALVNWQTQAKVPALKVELLNNISSLGNNEVVKAMSEDMAQAIPMPLIREIQFFWGPAENALRSVFATSDSIDSIQETAEQSYKTAAKIE